MQFSLSFSYFRSSRSNIILCILFTPSKLVLLLREAKFVTQAVSLQCVNILNFKSL
jgi:hypothetical protein